MKATRINGRQLTADHLRIWNQIQLGEPALASPYFCPGFTVAVAAVREDVEVAVLQDAGQIVGFLPFQRSAMSVGRPVGGALSDCQGVIVPQGVAWSVPELLRGAGLSVWDFDHLLASQTQFIPYHRNQDQSPFMDLSNGYEAYAEQRRAAGSLQILKTGNLERKLEREVGPLRFEAHAADPALLAQLVQWKRAQYQASNITDVFSFPWTVRLLEAILATQTQDFAGKLSVLYAGTQVVAMHMGMRSRTVWHYWFPVYNIEFAKYSAGLILLLKMAQSAPAAGLRVIDMGKGESMYKQRLASGAVPLAEGTVELPSLARTVRRLRGSAEKWAKTSAMSGLARISGRVIRRLERAVAVLLK